VSGTVDVPDGLDPYVDFLDSPFGSFDHGGGPCKDRVRTESVRSGSSADSWRLEGFRVPSSRSHALVRSVSRPAAS